MSNPILDELIAHEQYKDRLRHAEQIRQARAGSARQPADRVDTRASFGNLLIGFRHLFKALARAD